MKGRRGRGKRKTGWWGESSWKNERGEPESRFSNFVVVCWEHKYIVAPFCSLKLLTQSELVFFTVAV